MGGHYKAPRRGRARVHPLSLAAALVPAQRTGVSGPNSLRGPKRDRATRRKISWKRVLLWLAIAVAGWLLLSLVLFMVSAEFEQDQVSDQAKNQLDGSGPLPFVGEHRAGHRVGRPPQGTHEGGANVVGQPSRADTLLLIRTGGGDSSRLSIPRDTVVPIPGHGPDKINAAYAIGGPALDHHHAQALPRDRRSTTSSRSTSSTSPSSSTRSAASPTFRHSFAPRSAAAARTAARR